MNKMFTFLMASTCASVLYANHCPTPNEIFKKQDDKYITLTPSGWNWMDSWGGKPSFKSDEVKLNLVTWSESANRVHCIYGNPDFDGSISSGILQTNDVIPRSQVENKPRWVAYGEYFKCYGSDALSCQFG